MTDSASGLVVVDKGGGLTSHDVVARVRRLAGTRKVGHAGTLDPMATGVLVLGVNRATRLLGHLMLTTKAYRATAVLGVSTTTDDAEGELVEARSARHLTPDQIRAVFDAFRGEIDQVPTSVSAIKVDGQRAYARVRAGEQVDLASRRVTVHEVTVEQITPGPDATVAVDFSLTCSSGTYVRALARDAGAELGVGGHLSALRRTAVGAFELDRARTLDQLADHFELLPIGEAVRASFASRDLTEQEAASVRVGRALDLDLEKGAPTALFAPDGEFLALYRADGARARPLAVFVG